MSRLLRPILVLWLSLLGAALLLAACDGAAAPTPTPQPTSTLQAGWKRIASKNISVALPDTYEGGDLSGEDRKIIVERLKSLGPDFTRIATMIEQSPELYILFVVDTTPTSSGVLTNMNIAQERVLSSISPKTYMEAAAKQLPAAIEVKTQDEITIGGRPAGRMIAEWADQNVKQVLYVIKDENMMYVLTYTTGIDEFPQRFVNFEQSAQSFTINP